MKILILGFIIAQFIYFLYANYNFVDEFAYYGFTNKEDFENYKNSMTDLLNQPFDVNVLEKMNKLNPPNLEIYNMMNHEPYFKFNTGIVRIIVGVSFWLAVFVILFLFCDFLHRKLYG
jgi:hypothetical protein